MTLFPEPDRNLTHRLDEHKIFDNILASRMQQMLRTGASTGLGEEKARVQWVSPAVFPCAEILSVDHRGQLLVCWIADCHS